MHDALSQCKQAEGGKHADDFRDLRSKMEVHFHKVEEICSDLEEKGYLVHLSDQKELRQVCANVTRTVLVGEESLVSFFSGFRSLLSPWRLCWDLQRNISTQLMSVAFFYTNDHETLSPHFYFMRSTSMNSVDCMESALETAVLVAGLPPLAVDTMNKLLHLYGDYKTKLKGHLYQFFVKINVFKDLCFLAASCGTPLFKPEKVGDFLAFFLLWEDPGSKCITDAWADFLEQHPDALMDGVNEKEFLQRLRSGQHGEYLQARILARSSLLRRPELVRVFEYLLSGYEVDRQLVADIRQIVVNHPPSEPTIEHLHRETKVIM